MSNTPRLKEILTSETFLYLVFTMFFIGLYYSRAMVSMFDVGIFGIGLYAVIGRSDWRERIWNPYTQPFILIFVLYALSALTSSDLASGLHRIKMNNYYVLIPIGISCLQPMRKEFLMRLLLLFVSISLASALLVSINYLMNFEASNLAYKYGKTMETPILHIRYSYFICLAAIISLGLSLENGLSHVWKRFTLVAFLLLAVFLHVLAVRTGLLALYMALGALILWRGQRYFTRSQLAIGIIGGVITMIAAIRFIPTLAMKWQYSMHDLKMFFEDTSHHGYSDNLRIISIKNGIEIVKEHPFFGAGIGDIDNAVRTLYAQRFSDFPLELQTAPINQYVFTLAAFGIIGFVIFYGLLLSPYRMKNTRKNTLLVLMYVVVFASFLGDLSIELQLGKSAFLCLSALILWYGQKDNGKLSTS